MISHFLRVIHDASSACPHGIFQQAQCQMANIVIYAHFFPIRYQEFTGRSDKSKAAESTTFKEEGFTSADNVMVQNNDA